MRLIGIGAAAWVLAAAIGMPLSPVAADPIFAEDFEAYPAGSNLSGQGGWLGDDVRVGVGPGLGTQVLDGRIDAGPPFPPNTSVSVNRFAPAGLSPGHLYVLSFDALAWAWTGGMPSHNAGVYFHDTSPLAAQGQSIGWMMNWYGRSETQGWNFDARGLAADSTAWQTIAIAVDRPVILQVVLDPSIGKAWGVANFGWGVVTTNQFSFTPSRISGIDGVLVMQDFRSPQWYLGAEFDNILVFEDPVVGIAAEDWGSIKALYR